MDYFHFLAIAGYIVSIWAGYRGLKRVTEQKELTFGGIELLIFVLYNLLFWITIFVPGFWQ